jgi:hypothetical protein
MARVEAKVEMAAVGEAKAVEETMGMAVLEKEAMGMAEAMGMTVLIVPEAMAPVLRRYIAHNGRAYTTKPFTAQPLTGQPSTPAGKADAAPEPTGPDHAPQKAWARSLEVLAHLHHRNLRRPRNW